MNADRASKVVCFSDFQLDLRAGELSRNGTRIKVPLQSIQLLELLVERAGEVVTREELQKKLWPDSTIVEFEHSINAAMNRLRQALSDSADTPQFIETLPKRGYRFMISVAGVLEKPEAQASGDGPGSISSGQVLADRFRIVRLAGRGGMGEVYEAHDTRLDRRVALKFLPDEVARDPKALERFDAEARAIAALNHPHICTVYDTGTHENWPFIVMEFIEGETLATRLSKGALPADQVLRYAIEIADALDQAHGSGVVHRDLKPGNIMLTKSGVKVLDFGLAKRRALHAVAGETSLPPRSTPLTAEGAILGTFQYMAPEQLEGKEADARSDIFVFGAVVYEMATGRKAFEGQSQASVISAILHHEPAPSAELQPRLDRVLRACLSKDPNDRCQNAHDLCSELRWIREESTHVAAPAKKRVPAAWVLATGACVLAVLLGIVYLPKPPVRGSMLRFQIYPPEKTIFSIPNGPAALSPDGKRLAFAAESTETGQSLLWVRPLDGLAAESLAGTDGACCPFWSFDGRYLGFFADGKLKKIAVSGGSPLTLCDAGGAGPGGSWSHRGFVLFATDEGLESVAETGGKPKLVTALSTIRRAYAYMSPQFLPDGRHFIYSVIGASDVAGVYLGTLDAKVDRTPVKRLLPDLPRATYVNPGYLLFIRNTTLIAQPFDTDRLEITGEPISLDEGLSGTAYYPGDVTASETGVLAYQLSDFPITELVWFDRTGRRLSVVGRPARYRQPGLSPDEKRIVVERIDPTVDIWIIDWHRGVESRLTFDADWDSAPVWSRQGNRIVFTAFRKQEGTFSLHQRDASGTGPETIMCKHPNITLPSDWSHDGQFLLAARHNEKSRLDIWILPRKESCNPVSRLQTEANEYGGQFSADTRWIAYISDETGRPEVYVQTFPFSSSKWQVSVGGGTRVRWRNDGKELYYMAPDGKITAVELRIGNAFEAGQPRALFQTRMPPSGGWFLEYDVTGDGQRFLVNTISREQRSLPITVIVNWDANLKP